jgi:SulP family sulfate permease
MLLEPKLLTVLREGYGAALLRSDALAGLTVAVVALPLAMALAIASGVAPAVGLWTAVVAGFLISALGGSRVQIGGPTAAFIPVVAAVVQAHGMGGLVLCTLLAGLLLVAAGIARVGVFVRRIPMAVVVGFSAGIAVSIVSSQVRDALGLPMDSVPSHFLARWEAYAAHAGDANPAAVALVVVALAIILALRRWRPAWPGFLVAALACSSLAFALPGVDTLASRFGELPRALPAIAFPHIPFERTLELLPASLTIAFLAGIESLLSAVVADRLTGNRHRASAELVAQGVANIGSALIGGLPATGAIARPATNVRAGARTPVAGMVHALTLLAVLLAAAPLARFIPMPVLAAILLMVAWNMGEWHEIPKLLRLTRTDVAVWLVTFALTVFADLTIAVEVGMVLAALTFIRRVAVTTDIALVTPDFVEEGRVHILQDKPLPPYVAIFKIRGPFLFGSTDKLGEITRALDALPPIVILRLRHMTAIDATGLRAFEDLADRLRASGRVLILCGAREQPAAVMRQAQFHEHVGASNLCNNIETALARAAELHRTRAA